MHCYSAKCIAPITYARDSLLIHSWHSMTNSGLVHSLKLTIEVWNTVSTIRILLIFCIFQINYDAFRFCSVKINIGWKYISTLISKMICSHVVSAWIYTTTWIRWFYNKIWHHIPLMRTECKLYKNPPILGVDADCCSSNSKSPKPVAVY